MQPLAYSVENREGAEMTDQGAPVSTPAILLLFLLFVCLIAGCGYAVVAIWPPDCVNNQCAAHTAHLFLWALQLERAENLLLLVAATGALGALIHVTSSFADYVGNRRLVWSWVWWLLLRVPIGVALALVFYMLIRGGLIIPNGSTEPQINPYGIAGLAALVGMFAKQATDKLADIFDNLFRSDKDQARSDPLMQQSGADLSELRPPTASGLVNRAVNPTPASDD
jgi:hypothetical protein